VRVPVVLSLVLAVASPVLGQAVQLSGGVDGRFTYLSSTQETDAIVRGVFLNLRKVWRDESGDRWIAVAQGDLDDNLERLRPYQVYLQSKGPLGHWNVRVGHFLLPFSLLATYDTERLPLQGLEGLSLGMRKDTGVQVLGFAGRFDYAVALTSGGGERRRYDRRAEPVLTARFACVDDASQLGFSLLSGRPLPKAGEKTSATPPQKRRFALDLTRFAGPLTLHVEAVAGNDGGRAVRGGLFLADVALGPALRSCHVLHREGFGATGEETGRG